MLITLEEMIMKTEKGTKMVILIVLIVNALVEYSATFPNNDMSHGYQASQGQRKTLWSVWLNIAEWAMLQGQTGAVSQQNECEQWNGTKWTMK